MAEKILEMDLTEKLGYSSKGEVFEKNEAGYYNLKIHNLSENGEIRNTQEAFIPEEGTFFDLKFTKEGIAEYKIQEEKGEELYRDIIEHLDGKSIQYIISENKSDIEKYNVETSFHDPKKEGLEKNSYVLNAGEKIPGTDIIVDNEFLKSKLFEDLEIKYHWSEGKINIEKGTTLKGKKAYDFMKKLKEMDEEKSLRRAEGLEKGYDKTKLEIDYSPSVNNGLVVYNTGPIRIDLGDRELANSLTVSEAIRDRLLEHPKNLEKIANNELIGYNIARETLGMKPVVKDELLDQVRRNRNSVNKMYEQISKDEKLSVKYLEIDITISSRNKPKEEVVEVEKKEHYNIGTGKIYGEKFSEKLESAGKYRGYEKGEWVNAKYVADNEIKFKALEDGKEQKPVKITTAGKEIVDGQEKWTKKTFEFYNKEQLEFTKEQESALKEPIEVKKIEPQYNAMTGKEYSQTNSEKLAEKGFGEQRWMTKNALESIGGQIKEGQEPAKLEIMEYQKLEGNKVNANVKTIELYNVEQLSLDKVAEKQLMSTEEIKQSKGKSIVKEDSKDKGQGMER